MKNFVTIAVSLDGFIATKDGGIDWLPEPQASGDDGDFGFSEFMTHIDALLMGRNSFEKVLTFPSWPYEKKCLY